MSISVAEFWNVVVQSRLLTPQQCQQFAAAFAQIKGADPNGNATPLAEWLIAQQAISRYQAKVLLARQPGPFVYSNYVVYDRIESGRLYGLYRAVHLATHYPVCLYFFTGAASQNPQQFGQLSEFTGLLSTVRTPHLLRSFHAVDTGRYKFVVLDDVQGESLEPRLIQGHAPALVACGLVRHVALGCAQIHQMGQVHGEIRPGNVWLDPLGHAKLIYFPLWRDPWSGPTTPASPADRLAMAADYLAPEVAAGQLPDARSDVYSLGCLLYHLLTGRPPFDGAGAEQKLARHRMDVPRPADQVNPSVPPQIAQVVGYMLEKDPSRRYQHAGQVAQALQPYADPALAQPVPDPVTAVSQAYEAWVQHTLAHALPQAAAGGAALAPIVPAVASAATDWPPAATPVGVRGSTLAPVAVASVASAGQPMVSPIKTGIATISASRRGGRKSRQTLMMSGAVVGAVLVVLAVVFALSRPRTPDGKTDEGSNTELVKSDPVKPPIDLAKDKDKTPPNKNGKTPPPRDEFPIRPLKGDEFWASPTAGPPLDLTYMPGGVQAFIVLRPAELIAHPEGKVLLEPQALANKADTAAATGPLGPFAKAEVSRLCGGLPWDQLDQVVIGLIPNPPGTPLPAVVMRTKQPVALDSLTKAAGLEYRMPAGSQNVVVAAPGKSDTADAKAGAAKKEPTKNEAAPVSYIDDAMSHAKEPFLARREMEALLRVSDNQRHFSILCVPGFFYTDGMAAWSGLAEGLKQPLHGFLGDPLKMPAALLSFHFTNQTFFVELRLHGDAEMLNMASELDQKLRALPKEIKSMVVKGQWSPFAQPILFQFPDMVQSLVDGAMVGSCERHAVMWSYLPTRAASNLSHATFLALADTGGGGEVVAAGKTPSDTKSLADLLKTKTATLSGQDEFQRHVKVLADEIGVEIEIMGRDLESEGITRNKNTKVDLRDKPIGEILRSMFLIADPSGRLLYVIKKEGDKEKLYITVRKKADERKDPIPPEFGAPGKKKEAVPPKKKGKA